MNVPQSQCPHISIIGNCTKEDIIRQQEASECDTCDNRGPYLWVCLYRDCMYVGCSESGSNHWISHFEYVNEHSIFLNLTTLRVTCLLCDSEVFLENNDPPIPGLIMTYQKQSSKMSTQETDSDEDVDMGEENLKPRGLTGLQNLGNTCYMNSAIQALSNVPQLTYFFLECGAFVRSEKKPGLSKSYMHLVQEMWHKRRPSYVVPSSIAYGIKIVFPVFRGLMQQDAQEFLRYFLDQLHEELKEPAVEIPGISMPHESHGDFEGCHSESPAAVSEESSQSEAEFETCDSGLSSEKSSCTSDSGDCHVEAFSPGQAREDALKSNLMYGNFCIQHQVCQGSRSKLTEIDSEMKDDSNFDGPQGDQTALPTQSDTSDSGLPSSRAANFSDSNSLSEAKSPSLANKFECGEYKKYGRNVFSSRQSSTQTQLQRKTTSPYSVNGPFGARRRKPGRFRSIISDTFDGKILSSVQCLTCDTVSTTRETFQDLSLPIPSRDHLHMIHASQGIHVKGAASGGSNACSDVYSHQGWFSWFFSWMLSWFWGPSVSLQDCLAAFFSADELKGDNMYSCEKCKKLRNGIKYSKVLELPEVLCIHLKRFRHEVMFSSKISNYVSFPLEGLDMSSFLHRSYPSGVTMYDLAAVICHHGTAGSGHYTTYALNSLNDQWYEFDDQYVTAVDPQVVLNCEAYVLFYRKSTEEIIKKRQRAVELMDRSKSEHGLLQFHISKQWVNKFNTFAEPGPITNTDFLCVHGGVPPNRSPYVEDLCTILPQAVWEYLHDTFGGGPSCTHLYICPICQAEQESVALRRKTEHDQFVDMNNAFLAEDNPSAVYAISVSWFKLWENFVCGKESDSPGPIDNYSICYLKGSQRVLKLGSVYGSLSGDMWKYLHGIYGGGPEIILQQNLNPCTTLASHIGTSNTLTKSTAAFSQSNWMTNRGSSGDDTRKYNQASFGAHCTEEENEEQDEAMYQPNTPLSSASASDGSRDNNHLAQQPCSPKSGYLNSVHLARPGITDQNKLVDELEEA